MGGGGGGAWKVAYADFVTAMMAFFMVMWLTSQKPEVRKAVAEYFRDPYSFEEGPAQGDPNGEPVPPRLRAKRRDEPEFAAKAGQDEQPGAVDRADSADWHLDTTRFTLYYPTMEAGLSAAHKELLAERAIALLGKRLRVEVRGHCLRKPLDDGSGLKDHWELCFQRCVAVKRELVRLGVDPRLIRLSQAEGNEPAATGLDKIELAKNSRVDVYQLPQPVELP
ncbi:MAG: flagellar motor protein MotB [Lacipirellulaceae bacterium]